MYSQPDSEGLQVQDVPPERKPLFSTLEPTNAHDAPYEQAPYEPPLPPPPPAEGTPPAQRLPFGLSLGVFSFLLVLLTAIVVGGAVGGGLGAALANCKGSECSSSGPIRNDSCPINSNSTEGGSTGTITDDQTFATYAPKRPNEVDRLVLNCPDDYAEATEYTSVKFQTEFRWYCGVDSSGGKTEDGDPILDIAPIIAYSLEDCMDACAGVKANFGRRKTGVNCEAVVFRSRMKDFVEGGGANCWLKNGTRTRGWKPNKESTLAYAEIR